MKISNQVAGFWREFCEAEIGKEPNLEMPVNCERFELLYPKK